MAHRLVSHHYAFFSPRQLTSVTKFISTTTSRNYEVKDFFDFKEKVLQSKKPVVVDFHASWCAPCKQLAPLLDSAIEMNQGEVELAKVDIDNNAELAMQYNVSAIPTILAIKDGEVVGRQVGMLNGVQLQEFLTQLTKK